MEDSSNYKFSGTGHGYQMSAEASVYPSYSPTYAGADLGTSSLTYDPQYSWESNMTPGAAEVSTTPPYSWGSSGQVLSPEGASVSHHHHHQEPFVLDPSSDPSYHSYNTGLPAMGDTAALEEDINSWDMKTIKEVAVSLEASMRNGQTTDYGCPAMWGEGTSAQATAHDGLGSVAPYEEDLPSTSDGPQPAAPGGQRSWFPKVKMYQLGPQEDPDLEKRRKNAIKQKKKRKNDKKHEMELEATLTHVTQRVLHLQQEKQKREHTIKLFEAVLHSFTNQHGDIQQPHTNTGYFPPQ